MDNLPYVQNNIPNGTEDFPYVQSNFSNGQRDFPRGMDNFPQGIKDFPYVQSNIPEGIEDFPYGKTVNPSVGQGWEVVEKYISSQNCEAVVFIRFTTEALRHGEFIIALRLRVSVVDFFSF